MSGKSVTGRGPGNGEGVRTNVRDGMVKVGDNDKSPSYLRRKLITDPLTGIQLEVIDEGADEKIVVGISENYLEDKLEEGPGITLTPGPGGSITIGAIGGGSDANYIHNQVVPSATWTITHNLGKFASALVVDSGNTVVIGEIVFISTNVIQIQFNSAFGGKAYIN